MKRTTIFIDEQVDKEIQAIARRRGRSAASVVREALAAYIAEAGAGGIRPLSFVAAGGSGAGDIAERHEELLWADRQAPRPSAARPRAKAGRRRQASRRDA